MERKDIQRLLSEQISVLDESLMVIAEEFGDWLDSSRRIDLLCIDSDANLVVVELSVRKMAASWNCRPCATLPWSLR
jgi:RecB family endonuclease NucS